MPFQMTFFMFCTPTFKTRAPINKVPPSTNFSFESPLHSLTQSLLNFTTYTSYYKLQYYTGRNPFPKDTKPPIPCTPSPSLHNTHVYNMKCGTPRHKSIGSSISYLQISIPTLICLPLGDKNLREQFYAIH
jgi:hypothetical protein